MPDSLVIKNFKSIRNLDIPLKRVNVFMGEPNTGKSNITEALSFFSTNFFQNIKEIIRFNSVSELFYDFLVDDTILIILSEKSLTLKHYPSVYSAEFNATNSKYPFNLSEVGTITSEGDRKLLYSREFHVRYYKYNPKINASQIGNNFLNPPFGDNLVHLLMTNKELKSLISGIFKEKGYRLNFKPVERELLISKEVNGDIYSYPLPSISETLRRIIFLMAALESNKNCTFLFDEPEANTFPFFTTYFAERIALDKSNKYIFTTHNPYLLNAIIDKTPKEDLNLIITTMENFETKTYLLNSEQMDEAATLGFDLFFNLDKFTGK